MLPVILCDLKKSNKWFWFWLFKLIRVFMTFNFYCIQAFSSSLCIFSYCICIVYIYVINSFWILTEEWVKAIALFVSNGFLLSHWQLMVRDYSANLKFHFIHIKFLYIFGLFWSSLFCSIDLSFGWNRTLLITLYLRFCSFIRPSLHYRFICALLYTYSSKSILT